MVVLAVLVTGAIVASLQDEPASIPARPATTASADDETPPPAALIEHVNRRGNYSFSYPGDWTIDEKGPRTNLTDPSGEVVVSFGPLPADTGAEASKDLLGAIRSSYDGVRIGGRESAPVGRLPSRAVSGIATNELGARLHFLAIAIEGPGSVYGINVFTPASSDPAVVLPPVQAIVSSFQAL